MPANRKPSVKSPRTRSITRIHVAKRALCQSEEDYRFMLRSITGKSSLTTMSMAELAAVEAHQKKLGFTVSAKRTGQRRTSPASAHKKRHEKTATDKLRALWIEMAKDGLIQDGSEQALERWVQRMSARGNQGRGIEKVDWLLMDSAVCQRLIEQLKQWRQRMEAKQHD